MAEDQVPILTFSEQKPIDECLNKAIRFWGWLQIIKNTVQRSVRFQISIWVTGNPSDQIMMIHFRMKLKSVEGFITYFKGMRKDNDQ